MACFRSVGVLHTNQVHNTCADVPLSSACCLLTIVRSCGRQYIARNHSRALEDSAGRTRPLDQHSSLDLLLEDNSRLQRPWKLWPYSLVEAKTRGAAVAHIPRVGQARNTKHINLNQLVECSIVMNSQDREQWISMPGHGEGVGVAVS